MPAVKNIRVFCIGAGGQIGVFNRRDKDLGDTYQYLTINRGEVYDTADNRSGAGSKKEVAALERSGMIGTDLLELDKDGNIIEHEMSGQEKDKIKALVLAGVVSAKVNIPGFEKVKPEEMKAEETE